jgi:hypothetical protein
LQQQQQQITYPERESSDEKSFEVWQKSLLQFLMRTEKILGLQHRNHFVRPVS